MTHNDPRVLQVDDATYVVHVIPSKITWDAWIYLTMCRGNTSVQFHILASADSFGCMQLQPSSWCANAMYMQFFLNGDAITSPEYIGSERGPSKIFRYVPPEIVRWALNEVNRGCFDLNYSFNPHFEKCLKKSGGWGLYHVSPVKRTHHPLPDVLCYMHDSQTPLHRIQYDPEGKIPHLYRVNITSFTGESNDEDEMDVTKILVEPFPKEWLADLEVGVWCAM